jgi:hypothetical protein
MKEAFDNSCKNLELLETGMVPSMSSGMTILLFSAINFSKASFSRLNKKSDN